MDGLTERRDMMRSWAAHDATLYRNFTGALERLLPQKRLHDLDVLDLGCGVNAPMALMLHASGCRVTGVDWNLGLRWGLGFSLERYRRFASETGAGVGRLARKFLGELAYDRTYYATLASASGLRLSEKDLDLRAMDVERMDFPDQSFDVVHSNATFEHLRDVPTAARELARILRPGGLAHIEIHLFPSLSGGHDLPWIVPDKLVMDGIKPWQHLRDPNWKEPVYLNRLRERDYRRIFDATPGLRVLEWNVEFTEGKHLLTPEIAATLPDYTERDLTTRSIIVIAQRDPAGFSSRN